MKHLGDITKLKGDQVPLVDIITGGSPCQDLSVAGKRAGLAGERSGLFMEQIRLVKEMRDESRRQLSIQGTDYDLRDIKPRYMVWENVTGAFSSGTPKGADFAAVLEEICKVVVKEVPPISIPKNGWPYAGSIDGVGDDGIPFSICWRLHDAQYWGKTVRDSYTGNVLKMGTPQRRRRIALIADFGGITAPEILFESTVLQGNLETEREARKTTSGYIETGPDKSVTVGIDGYNASITGNKSMTLTGAASDSHHIPSICSYSIGNDQADNAATPEYEICKTLNCMSDPMKILCYGLDRASFNQGQNAKYDFSVEEEKAQPLVARGPGGVMTALSGPYVPEITKASEISMLTKEKSLSSLITEMTQKNDIERSSNMKHQDYKEPQSVSQISLLNSSDAQGNRVADSNGIYPTLRGSVGIGYCLDHTNIIKNAVVRRLTPKEAERLQGFPDNWTRIGEWVDSKGKKHKESDGPRFKALGNSIALPFWEWLATRMCDQLRKEGYEDLTMASLFDGIGGFPLVFQRNGCEPVWASEIEEFPIAVTKYHFGKD